MRELRSTIFYTVNLRSDLSGRSKVVIVKPLKIWKGTLMHGNTPKVVEWNSLGKSFDVFVQFNLDPRDLEMPLNVLSNS